MVRGIGDVQAAGWRVGGREGRAVALLIAAAIAAATVIPGAASARVAADPCGLRSDPHVTSSGLHCSAIFQIRAQRTSSVPEAGAAPNCPQGEQLRGKWGDHGYEAEWDYWTRNGQWITWTGHVGYRFRHPEVHGVGPDNLLPSFHNSGTDGWTMRILFRCMPTAPA